MGVLRVVLALSVLLAHIGGIGGFTMATGPVAVQSFFIISGFYMALVLNERYDRHELNRSFYVSRALRIFSLYAVFLLLSLGVYAWVQQVDGRSPLWPYLGETVSWPEKLGMSLLNLTIVGQDITQFIAIDGGHFAWTDDPFHQNGREAYRFMLVPVSWTLALEIYFYALAPFIVRRPAWQIACLMGASLLARVAAAWGGLAADPFSYRFFPFELALFLAGALAYKAWAACPRRWERGVARLLAPAALAALAAYPWLLGDWPDTQFFTPPRIGTLLLVALALPAVHSLTRNSHVDRSIGELSYPVYLSHELVYGLLPKAGTLGGAPVVHALTVTVVTLALSWLVVRFLDAPVTAFRHQLARRARQAASKGGDRLPGFA